MTVYLLDPCMLGRTTHLPSSTTRSSDRAAFTLVELLVVIGIIAVLIGILLPVLNKAQSSARNTKCLSNQHQVFLAVRMFANEHGDFAPGSANATVDPTTGYGTGIGQLIPLDDSIADAAPQCPNSVLVRRNYLRNRQAFRCPEMERASGALLNVMTAIATVPAPWKWTYMYSFNETFVGDGYNVQTETPIRSASGIVYRLSKAKPAADTVLIADMYSGVEYLRSSNLYLANGTLNPAWPPWSPSNYKAPTNALHAVRVSPYHNRRQGIVVTFADGHSSMETTYISRDSIEAGLNWQWMPTADLSQ